MATDRACIRVLIVDDHPLLRQGVAAVLQEEPDVEIVAQASNGREAVAAFEAHRPDVTLMDLQMPEMSGIDAIVRIRERFANARIVVLTTYKGDVSALRALRAGAVGYLLKSQVLTELVATVRTIHAGAKRIPPEISAALSAHLGEHGLTEREIQVLRLVAQGYSNKRAAVELGVSEDTIKAHMKSIVAKLDASDRTHAVTIALRRGILEL